MEYYVLLLPWMIAVCEYYAHVDCQDFAVSDCKECATYVPAQTAVVGAVASSNVR